MPKFRRPRLSEIGDLEGRGGSHPHRPAFGNASPPPLKIFGGAGRRRRPFPSARTGGKGGVISVLFGALLCVSAPPVMPLPFALRGCAPARRGRRR